METARCKTCWKELEKLFMRDPAFEDGVFVPSDVIDRIKVATFMGTDRPHVLRQAIHCCRNFGTVSIVGVYGGFVDNIPMGSAINRGLTFRMAQTPVLPVQAAGTHRERRDRSVLRDHPPSEPRAGPELYKTFRDKKDNCIKVVMKP